jgi:transcriptional regulator with XRE-family HTH domain
MINTKNAEPNSLTKQFSHRLREALIAAGHDSDRSISGVNLQKLVEITGYSIQICRKYLRGETLPDTKKIIEIAQALKVTPGWLLFAEVSPTLTSDHEVTIPKKLLQMLFAHIHKLYTTQKVPQDITDLLLSLADNLGQLKVDETQAIKIIEIAFSSMKYFNRLPAVEYSAI